MVKLLVHKSVLDNYMIGCENISGGTICHRRDKIVWVIGAFCGDAELYSILDINNKADIGAY